MIDWWWMRTQYWWKLWANFVRENPGKFVLNVPNVNCDYFTNMLNKNGSLCCLMINTKLYVLNHVFEFMFVILLSDMSVIDVRCTAGPRVCLFYHWGIPSWLLLVVYFDYVSELSDCANIGFIECAYLTGLLLSIRDHSYRY